MISFVSTHSMASCELNVLQELDYGMIAQVELTNDTDRAIEDWDALLFLNNGYIETIWGDGVHSGDNVVTISPTTWEGPVGVGESRVFYFTASTLDGTAISEPDIFSIFCPTQVPIETFIVSDFAVSYFHEDDGQLSGKGTDGFDPNITETLISQDVVDEIDIFYFYSDFENINAHNFFASWEGTISVVDNRNPIIMTAVSLASNVNVYINGDLIESFSSSAKTLSFDLPKGEHDIRIEFHNHSDAAVFSVNFTDDLL